MLSMQACHVMGAACSGVLQCATAAIPRLPQRCTLTCEPVNSSQTSSARLAAIVISMLPAPLKTSTPCMLLAHHDYTNQYTHPGNPCRSNLSVQPVQSCFCAYTAHCLRLPHCAAAVMPGELLPIKPHPSGAATQRSSGSPAVVEVAPHPFPSGGSISQPAYFLFRVRPALAAAGTSCVFWCAAKPFFTKSDTTAACACTRYTKEQ